MWLEVASYGETKKYCIFSQKLDFFNFLSSITCIWIRNQQKSWTRIRIQQKARIRIRIGNTSFILVPVSNAVQ